MPGVIPGRGMACVDLCPHHITRESSWRSGGAHERGKDEDHRPRAVPPSRAWRARAALRPRQYSAWHVGMCRVVAGGGREPEQDGWSQVAVWRHRPASRSPRGLCLSERRVGWVPVCARGVRGEVLETGYDEDRSRTDCTGSSDVDYNTIVRGQRTEMYPTVSMDRITSRIQFQLVQGSSTATHTAPVNHRPGSWVSEAQLSVGPLKLVSAKARAARLSARHDATAAAAPEAAGAER